MCIKALSCVLASLQEPQVVLGCVQLLQSLSQHKQHLKDLPSKTMMDILTEVTNCCPHYVLCPHIHSYLFLQILLSVRSQRRCLRRSCWAPCRRTWSRPLTLQSSCSCCWWPCNTSRKRSNPRNSRSCWVLPPSSTRKTSPGQRAFCLSLPQPCMLFFIHHLLV